MKVKEIFRQASFNIIGYAFNIITVIITIPILSKFLDSERLGLYFLFNSFIGYYSILDFGLTQGIIKYISKYDTLDHKDKFNEILTSVFLFYLIISAIIFLIIIFFSNKIIKLLNITNNLISEANYVIFFVTISFIFSLLNSIFSSSFQAIMRFDLSNLLNLLSVILLNLFTIILLVNGLGLIHIFITQNIIFLMLLVISAVLFKKQRNFIKLNFNNSFRNIITLMRYSFFVFISKLSNHINTNFIPFFLSYFHSPAIIPYFFIPLKLMNIVSVIISSFSNTILPVSSKFYEKNKIESIDKLISISNYLIFYFLTPLYLFLFLSSFNILTLWVNEDFAHKSYKILSLISISYYLSSYTVTPSMSLLGIGESKFIGMYSFILSIISFSLNLLMIKYFSYMGAGFSNLIISFNSFLFIFLAKRKLNLRLFEQYRIKIFKVYKLLLTLTIMYTLHYVSISFELPNLAQLIIQIIIIILYYISLVSFNIKEILNFFKNEV